MLTKIAPIRQLTRVYGAILTASQNSQKLADIAGAQPSAQMLSEHAGASAQQMRELVDRVDYLCRKESERALQTRAQDLAALRLNLATTQPENVAIHGWNSYAQCDEDGIIRECLRRIGEVSPLTKTFIEVGCADGLENNTHQLALDGYRGCWLDGDPAKINYIAEQLGSLQNHVLFVTQGFATLETIRPLMKSFIDYLETADIDFFSFDVDGNDAHLVRASLELLRPKLLCVEYQGTYPPPTRLTMAYRADHRWAMDDYFGATLQTWIDILPGYRLVTCNLSGANAFFVRDDLAHAFTLYEPAAVYQPPRYWLVGPTGHQASLRFLRQICTEVAPENWSA